MAVRIVFRESSVRGGGVVKVQFAGAISDDRRSAIEAELEESVRTLVARIEHIQLPPVPAPQPAGRRLLSFSAVGPDGRRYAGLTILLRVDNGYEDRQTTDENGRVTFDVPPDVPPWGAWLRVGQGRIELGAMRAVIPPAGDHEMPDIPIRSPRGGGGGTRAGIVRAAGRAFVDDTGPFLPVGHTFFWGLWGWKHDRDRCAQNLEWLAQKGFHYVRTLCEVGGAPWSDRTVDPNWLDYQAVLAGYLDACYARGLRTELTLIGGGTGFDPIRLVEKVIEVGNARPHTIMHYEVANEFDVGPKIDTGTMQRAGRRLRDATPNLVALSSVRGGFPDPTRALMEAGNASMFSVHTDRDVKQPEGTWRQVRQAWDLNGLRWPGTHNEGPGPGSSVATNTSPIELAMMRAVAALAGVGMFVLHNASGIYGKNTSHPVGGARPANVWEMHNIDAIADAVIAIGDDLPPLLPNWQKVNNHWQPPNPVHPLQADPNAHWPDGADHGVTKNYGAQADGEFVTLPMGVKGHVDMTARRACSIEVINPITGDSARHDLAAGELIRLDGSPAREYPQVAYVVRGRFR
jgi:hypothetical protein